MSQAHPTIEAGTGSADYSAAYFHGYSGPPYTYDEPHWKIFFGRIADSLVALFDPATTYDAGCAKGFLVRALAERGVDARGGDISEFAIAGAPAELAERLEVRDLTVPFDGRYELITCIEVLEHMSADDARIALANLCAATDRVVLSTTPDDFAEPTHINIRQPAAWAQDFAVHGFYRRTDLDLSFVSPWAVVFEGAAVSPVELVSRYENLLGPVLREVQDKRRALLEVRREVDEINSPVIIERDQLAAERDRLAVERDRLAAERDRLAAELAGFGAADLAQERINRLAMADELIGLRAELAETRVHAENAVAAARAEADRLRATLDSVQGDLVQARKAAAGRTALVGQFRSSLTWRIRRTALLPLRAVRRWARR